MQSPPQDTGKFRTQLKDQFYTKPTVAAWFVQAILKALPWSASPEILWIEPSAGSGAFLAAAPAGVQTLGLDIDPQGPGITRQDFLTWTPPTASLHSSSAIRLLVARDPLRRRFSSGRVDSRRRERSPLCFLCPSRSQVCIGASPQTFIWSGRNLCKRMHLS